MRGRPVLLRSLTRREHARLHSLRRDTESTIFQSQSDDSHHVRLISFERPDTESLILHRKKPWPLKGIRQSRSWTPRSSRVTPARSCVVRRKAQWLATEMRV